MVRKIAIIIITYLCFSQAAFAAYYASETFIKDNMDAQTKCLLTCNHYKADWTGHWWSSSDAISLCECFYAWPYCPVSNTPPPTRGCVPGWGSYSN